MACFYFKINTCAWQFMGLMSYLQVRMNEAKMLYFHSKLPDPARGTNSEHLGNVFVFVWAYKMECTCFENNFCPSLSAKSKKKVNLPKCLAAGETSAILCRRYDNCHNVANLYSSTIKPSTKTCVFKDL